MWDVSGVSGAAPIWRSVMQFLEENDGDLQRAQSPVPPAGVVLARVRFPEGLEASREEWFLEGTAQTEMALANTEQVARSRIASPTDGTIVALDPDIPARAQRLRFRTVAQAAQSGSWRLDGRILGHAGPLDWALWPGRHVLELVSAQGAVLDRVQFEVRGAQLRAEPRPSSKPGLTRPVSLRLAGESEDALP
jgi:penicillin-binding protein 1C